MGEYKRQHFRKVGEVRGGKQVEEDEEEKEEEEVEEVDEEGRESERGRERERRKEINELDYTGVWYLDSGAIEYLAYFQGHVPSLFVLTSMRYSSLQI